MPAINLTTVTIAEKPAISFGINPISIKIGPAKTAATDANAVKYPTIFCIVGDSPSNHSFADLIASIILINASPNFTPRSAACPSNRSEEHTSELQSRGHLVCRLLLDKKNEDKT